MKNKNDKIRFIADAGVLLALILIFMLVPMNTGLFSIAVIALMAVIVGTQFDGLIMGLFLGLAFGLASLIASFTTAAGSLTAPLFHNPLISIFPRMVIPLTTYFSYVGMRKAFKLIYSKKSSFNESRANHLSITISSLISAIVGVTTNTALVMAMIFIFKGGSSLGDTVIGKDFLIGALSVNYPIELSVCLVAVPAVVFALKAAFHKKVDVLSPKILHPLDSDSH